MATMTISTFTNENKTFYEKALLKRFKEKCRLYDLAKKTILPKKSGNTISWRKFLKLELPTAALVEGVTPTANHLDIVNFSTSLKQYGDYITLSDLIDLIGIDPVIAETSQLFGEQIAVVIDNLIRDELLKSCNVYYEDATNGTNSAISDITASDTISIKGINSTKAILKRYGAEPFENGKFLWFISPEMEYDLKSISGAGLLETWKYKDIAKIRDGEIGEFLGFRFIVDSNVVKISPDGASDAKVHKSIILGKFRGEKPFGVVELEGETGKPSIIFKGLGSAGTADPLDQRQTLGWNLKQFGARLLYEEAIMVYCCGSSLTPYEFADNYQEYDREHYAGAKSGNALAITNTLTSGNLNVVAGATVTITHNGRKDYTYTLASATTAKATVSGMVVTGVATGTSVVTLTCTETGQTATVTVNVTSN